MLILDASLLDKVLPTLCDEFLALKRSYFTPNGKPGAGWNPLKESTIKRKKENKLSFNTETGWLKDSLSITYDIVGNEIVLSFEANHKNGDEAIDQLIYKYGRNFLDFSDDEIDWLGQKLVSLIEENI